MLKIDIYTLIIIKITKVVLFSKRYRLKPFITKFPYLVSSFSIQVLYSYFFLNLINNLETFSHNMSQEKNNE